MARSLHRLSAGKGSKGMSSTQERPKPFLMPQFCKGCGRCIESCAKHCIEPGTEVHPETGLIPVVFDLENCSACGLCMSACPEPYGLAPQPESSFDLFLNYIRLGRTLAKLKQREDAAKALDTAMEVKPEGSFPACEYQVALGNFEVDRFEQGMQALARAKESGHAFWTAVAEREMMEQRLLREVDQELNKNTSLGEG